MADITEREEIEVELRYIRRVRSMQPSAQAIRDLDRQESELKRRLAALPDATSSRGGNVSLTSDPHRAGHRRAGFGS